MKALAQERERRGWTRAELARQASLNASQVGLFEAGRLLPYESQLGKLARALGWPEAEASRLLEEADCEPVVEDLPAALTTTTTDIHLPEFSPEVKQAILRLIDERLEQLAARQKPF